MAFKKLNIQKKRDYVVSEILDAIQRGDFKIGDRLPSEQSIAESIGVSRPSIREALGALRIVGVIETINGYGTVVKRDDLKDVDDLSKSQKINILGENARTFETLEARKVIEPAVAVYILEMINERNVAPMESAFSEMEAAAADEDFQKYHEANKKFHLAIANISQNDLLINTVKSLINLFTDSDYGAEMRRRYLTDSSYIVSSLKVHKDLLVAIKSKNQKKVINAYKNHDRQVDQQLIGK